MHAVVDPFELRNCLLNHFLHFIFVCDVDLNRCGAILGVISKLLALGYGEVDAIVVQIGENDSLSFSFSKSKRGFLSYTCSGLALRVSRSSKHCCEVAICNPVIRATSFLRAMTFS